MIYFVQAESGPIKIGYVAANRSLRGRLDQLQVGNHETLHLLAVLPNGGPGLERQLHRAFASVRVRGEWFDGGDSALRKLVVHYQEHPEADAIPMMRLWPGLAAASTPSTKQMRLNAASAPWDAVREVTKPEHAPKPKPRLGSPRTEARRARRINFQRAVDEGMVFRPLTEPGVCVSCGSPRPVLVRGEDAGCHVAGSACEHCGHIEPA